MQLWGQRKARVPRAMGTCLWAQLCPMAPRDRRWTWERERHTERCKERGSKHLGALMGKSAAQGKAMLKNFTRSLA